MVRFGVSSMVTNLREVLVQAPGTAFAAAYDDPRHGYLHPVDLDIARKEHQALVELLGDLGCNVHVLADETQGPDFVYQYDTSLVTRNGAILLRSGKPTRQGEELVHEDWYRGNDVPVIGRIEPPGTVDGGDVFWLSPEVLCVGRTLRSNQDGIDQLLEMVDEEAHVFDMPYDRGPNECLHLLSVISPVAEDLVVVEMARLPVGLFQLCQGMGVEMIPVPPEEVSSLGCNILAVAPGVVVMIEGSPITAKRLRDAGVEVHLFEGREICLNGGGGPTCLTRPILRSS